MRTSYALRPTDAMPRKGDDYWPDGIDEPPLETHTTRWWDKEGKRFRICISKTQVESHLAKYGYVNLYSPATVLLPPFVVDVSTKRPAALAFARKKPK